MINEGTWSIPNNIMDLYNLNSLRNKKVNELTSDEKSLLYRVCGSDDFFDNLYSHPRTNVWKFIYSYLERTNTGDWNDGFYPLKYYPDYGWAFEDMRQSFRSLFTQE